MIPDPGEILRRRTTAATTIRILALVPLFAGVCTAALWGYSANENRLYPGEHTGYAIAIAVFAGFGFLQWVLAPWHARWSIKMPKSVVCPACNYKIAGLTEARCPECGLPLTVEFLAAPGERTPPHRDPDRAMLRQVATTAVRIVAIIIIMITLPFLIYTIVETVQFYSASSTHYQWDQLFWNLEVSAWSLVFGITFFVLGKRFSAIIVPSREAVGGEPRPHRILSSEPGSSRREVGHSDAGRSDAGQNDATTSPQP